MRVFRPQQDKTLAVFKCPTSSSKLGRIFFARKPTSAALDEGYLLLARLGGEP